MNNLKKIAILFIWLQTCSANAFDYQRCMDLSLDRAEFPGMKDVLSQVIQLENMGQNEEVNFEALAYLSTTVDAYFIGFVTARTILYSAKFQNKESELNSKEAFKNVASRYVKSFQNYSDFVNKSIVFVKNQSVRDDLKSINRKNVLSLQKLAVCSN